MICNQCSNNYERIGQHWSMSNSCNHPKLGRERIDIVIGSLMGDGSLNRNQKNAYLKIDMINKKYLEYLDDVFGNMSKGVKLIDTAQESYNKVFNREKSCTNPSNYSNLYRFTTVSHPTLNEFREWYMGGEKVWPDNIKLTPTVLKHWYVGDGHANNKSKSDYISISASNEIGNKNKIDKYFENVGLPKPNNYRSNKRKEGGRRFSMDFSVQDSKILWEYMGNAPSGFEYKWVNN